MRPRFHLAFPVTDLVATRSFYTELLGARVGRESDRWIDFDCGPHNICASYYHFQLYLKGAQSMLKISRIISKFTSPTSPLVHKIYKHLSNTEPEAEIRLLYQFSSNPQTLHSSLSKCISNSLSNQIDIKHLLP